MASKENGTCAKRYVMGEKLTVEEDLWHEFKGHRNFCREELPHIAIYNRTRKPISRNLCGFLNSGLGGIVYCGVTDDGTVRGFSLTEYQKDHILLSIQDTFSRYDPPVNPDMYAVSFTPVLTDMDQKYEIPSPPANVEQRNKPHILRAAKYCWCDNDGFAQFDLGILAQLYVIEIEVFPWNPESELAVSPLTPLQPLFCDEEKQYFIRRSGGLHQPSLAEVIQLAEAETYQYHTKIKK